ncbi:MAG: 50S ribosomal protein L19, partial [Candidatus Delongbacteria bacterium]
MDKLNLMHSDQIKEDTPDFHAGDTLEVHQRIAEGNKERIQVFAGVVIKLKGSGVGKTFTIRKISNGVGVERIFPVNSPYISKIVRLKEGKVRQAKIYYFRKRKGKSARIQEVRKSK